MQKILLLITTILLSCAGNTTTSSDILGKMPRYLGVAVFDGSYPYGIQASSQFAHGLMEMGLQVIEHINLPTDPDDITKISNVYGVSGLFVGSIKTVFTPQYLDTYLYIRLIDMETGRTIWSVSAKEPRYFTLTYDLSKSVYHTTNQALRHFKNDIRRAK